MSPSLDWFCEDYHNSWTNFWGADHLTGIDPRTKKTTPLFHPRRHKWSRHFRWAGPFLIGLTAIGRTTIQVLAMNDLDLVRVREELIEEGVFPP